MRVRRTPNPPRRGVHAVEAAIVLPVLMMLILGTWSTAMGVYYYQLVATLAREGARYASVHGEQYFLYTGNNSGSGDIYLNAIKPWAVGLDLSKLTYQVQFGTAVSGNWVWNSWVSSSNSPPTSPPGPLYNGVQVTVTYQWTPVYIIGITGPLTLTSTSVMPMSF